MVQRRRQGRHRYELQCPHRSQFEIVCDKGVIKVDDLVGGQGRSGNFNAYESPFVGSESFVVGDEMGKDTVQQVEACDHENRLVEEFCANVQGIRAGSSGPNPEWSKRKALHPHHHGMHFRVVHARWSCGGDFQRPK